MTRVFVSGCYDIIHAGHVTFFKQARAFGDHLTVCFASDEVYRAWKGREPALPEDSRRAILEELRCVDRVVMSDLTEPWGTALDFASAIIRTYPPVDVLVSTDDDANEELKREFCRDFSIRFVQVPKLTHFTRISTSEIRERIAK